VPTTDAGTVWTPAVSKTTQLLGPSSSVRDVVLGAKGGGGGGGAWRVGEGRGSKFSRPSGVTLALAVLLQPSCNHSCSVVFTRPLPSVGGFRLPLASHWVWSPVRGSRNNPSPPGWTRLSVCLLFIPKTAVPLLPLLYLLSPLRSSLVSSPSTPAPSVEGERYI